MLTLLLPLLLMLATCQRVSVRVPGRAILSPVLQPRTARPLLTSGASPCLHALARPPWSYRLST
jgi:hypothetical protein